MLIGALDFNPLYSNNSRQCITIEATGFTVLAKSPHGYLDEWLSIFQLVHVGDGFPHFATDVALLFRGAVGNELDCRCYHVISDVVARLDRKKSCK